MANRFEKLAAIDCSNKTDSKNGLTYLSWAWAWDQFKRVFPDSYYTIYEAENGNNYFTDGRTCWVKTGVTLVDGDFKLEHIEYLPVMDFRNNSIPLNGITSMHVNKAIQRSLTKAVARHGLGLYIYAGEDIPAQTDVAVPSEDAPICSDCGKPIMNGYKAGGEIWYADDIAKYTKLKFGRQLCVDCGKKSK